VTNPRFILCGALLAWLGLESARANTVCPLPESVVVADGTSLALVGAGLRTYWQRPINAVALYADAPVPTWYALQQSSGRVQVDVIFHAAHFTREQFHNSWRERFQATLSAEELSHHAQHINRLIRLFVDAKRGDTLSFTVAADQLTLSLNGRSLGTVGDRAFGLAVMSGWLGDRPADDTLKRAIFARARLHDGVPCRQ
jgi:hypothetical protein